MLCCLHSARLYNGRLSQMIMKITTSRVFISNERSTSSFIRSRESILKLVSPKRNDIPILHILSGGLGIGNLLYHPVRGIRLSAVSRNINNNSESNGNNGTFSYAAILTAVAISIYALLYFFNDSNNKAEVVSWKEFIDEILPSGEVKYIYISPSIDSHSLRVVLQPDAQYHGVKRSNLSLKVINISDFNSAEASIRAIEKQMGIDPLRKVPIIYNDYNFGHILAIPIALLLLVLLTRFLTKRLAGISSDMGNFMATPMKAEKISTGIRFSDVAGCTEAKQEVMEFVHFLKDPKKYEKLGAKMPRGCLLTGPPGVGKTLLAKAVATEAEVPFLFKAGSDFVEMIGGLGAKRVRDLFKEARKQEPCIVYIDELDALGGKRSASDAMGGGASEKDQTLNQVLVEMDGMFSSNHNVIVIGSTNRADILDRALLRPGRFDRHIDIDLPSRFERKDIFEQHLKSLKLMEPADTYSERLSHLTPGMSGAEIANICNEAAIFAAREKDNFIDSKHFEYAVERVLAGSARKSSSMSTAERKIVAVHEAGHALVGWLLEHTDALVKVSIVPRTKAALGFTQTLPSERKLYSREQLSDVMSMALGGRVAENLVFGYVTQGAQDDLKKVTRIASAQVKDFGFSPVIGNVSFSGQNETYVKPYSDALAAEIDQEVNRLVKEAHNSAQRILRQNVDKLKLLSDELLKREVLNYADIVEILGIPPHGDKTQVYSIGLPVDEDENKP